MGEVRPKVVVVGGPGVPADDLVRLLRGSYDVVVSDGAGVRSAAASGSVAGAASVGDASNMSVMLEAESAAVLNAIGEGVCLTTVEGHVVWANDRFRSFDDQTRARIVAVCRRAAQHFDEQLMQQDAPGYNPGGKFEVASPDESKFYEVVVAPVRQPTVDMTAGTVGPGRPERIAALVWDITRSKRIQQKMDAIDRAGSELVRLDAEAIRKKHIAERLKLLEEKVVRYCHELLHFDHLSIRLLDERTGKLELVIAKGMAPEAVELELFAQKEGNGIMGFVAATGRSYLCPDVTKDRRYVIGQHGAKSSLTVPLRLHDKVIGAFNVESERVAAFTEEDRQFGEIFANHVAMALHILDLLLVESCATGVKIAGTVKGELDEPLDDILKEADMIGRAFEREPELREHVTRILRDVAAIKKRLQDAAEGPQTILGAERALMDAVLDPQLAGRRVLVADDEPKIRQVIREVLRRKGCDVTVCSNGAEAIVELELSAEAAGGAGRAGGFSLVLSDIKMPDKNGYEVFAVARRTHPRVPVILMTGFGYDPHHSIVRASQEGLQCVLFKPFQIERLLEEVKKAVAAGGDDGGGGSQRSVERTQASVSGQ